ncbi:MAG TPA: glycoside hydrolase domain-containing protein [Candidatus Sulfotelmatobacter sp.]|nr:glycoside hydrolase domain-containing protein [Candidatus Sulfotelmatobacter sp.]
MSFIRSGALLFSLFILTTNVLASQPAQISVWPVDSLTKVFPNDVVRASSGVPEAWAARGQHISIQFAIRSAKALNGMSAEVNLKNAKGEPCECVTVRQVGYVAVGSHTDNTPPEELIGEAPGLYPDPLWNMPMDLEKNRTHSVWITVSVPSDAASGLYRGTLLVNLGKQTLARREFRVRVVAATVPTERTLKVTNWFNVTDAASRQFYDAPEFSEAWWTMVENLGRVMADHRQNMVITPLMDLVTPHVDGAVLTYDFSNFDRWVETFRRAGVIGYIEGSHLLGRAGSYDAALTVPAFVVENGKVVRQELAPDDLRVEPYLTGFLAALNTHLTEKNWKSIYFQHILDEPHGNEPPQYARVGELVHKKLPGVLTMDAIDASEMRDELKNNCDIWVPQLGRFDSQMDLIRDRIQSGHEVWYYTCLFPNKRYLNRLMDYPLLKVRLLHWLNFQYGFTGFLHWGWNYWTPEPVKDTQPVIDANTQLLPAGDAFIVYPDRAGKSVYSSIRLETMREGIEDYELLMLLRQKNPALAEQLSQAAIQSFTEYVRDPAAFRVIEKRLLEALSN